MNTPRNAALRVLLIAGLLLVWEAAVRALSVPAYILPAPSGVFMGLWRGFGSGVYVEHIGAIVAEFVGADAGLGMLTQSMNFSMDVAGQFSVLLILSAIGLALNACVTAVRSRVLYWDTASRNKGQIKGTTP